VADLTDVTDLTDLAPLHPGNILGLAQTVPAFQRGAVPRPFWRNETLISWRSLYIKMTHKKCEYKHKWNHKNKSVFSQLVQKKFQQVNHHVHISIHLFCMPRAWMSSNVAMACVVWPMLCK
jgi:hypothetical protein